MYVCERRAHKTATNNNNNSTLIEFDEMRKVGRRKSAFHSDARVIVERFPSMRANSNDQNHDVTVDARLTVRISAFFFFYYFSRAHGKSQSVPMQGLLFALMVIFHILVAFRRMSNISTMPASTLHMAKCVRSCPFLFAQHAAKV